MANQGAKKRKEENQRHMKNLLRLIVVCNAIYVLVRLLIFHSSFTWKHWIGLLLTSMAYGLSYHQLSLMAKPAYSDEGELLDGGFDMNTGGVCGYRDLDCTSFLMFRRGSCSKVQRLWRKTRRPGKRGKRWRRGHLGPDLLGQSIVDYVGVRRALQLRSLSLEGPVYDGFKMDGNRRCH